MAGEGNSAQGRVVELRVHGVGGTSPENLLDHPRPDKIAGDDISGFYRRPKRDDLEAYSWGGLTSNSGARAGWLLLLPFALGNVAGWLLPHPPGDDPSRTARVQKALVRLGALLITAVYVLWVGQIAVDLLAYQCGGQEACYEGRWWLSFFENGFFGTADDPHVSRRLVVGMLVPLGFVALLAYLGRTSRNRYEEQFTHEVGDTDPGADPALIYGLEDGPFWHGSEVVERLARLHIGVALAAIAGATADALWRLEDAAGSDGWKAIFLVVFGLTIAWLALLTLATGYLSKAQRYARGLQWGAGLLVAAVVVLALLRAGPPVVLPGVPQILPGFGRFSLAATLVLMVLVVILLVALVRDKGRKRLVHQLASSEDPPAGFNGLGAFAALTMGALLLGVVLAGTVVRVAGWLDREGDPALNLQPVVVEYTNGYDWLAVLTLVFGLVIVLVVAVRIALLIWGKNGWRAQRWFDEIEKDYAGVTTDPRPEGCADVEGRPCPPPDRDKMLEEVSKARRIRTAIGVADLVVLRLVVLIVGAVVVLFVVRAILNEGDVLADIGELPGWAGVLLAPATWLATVLPLVFLETLRRAYRDPTTRRRVGTVWDIVTFWPRWYHPLSPPSYATRAVPQVRLRLDRLAAPEDDTARPVLLSSHSQGTVLAAAVVLRLDSPTKERVALLTHGSPLRRLYGRFFPAQFGRESMERMESALTTDGRLRWINLYRLTDPIGGAVFGEEPFALGEPGPWLRRLRKYLPWLFVARRREHGEPTAGKVDVLVPDPITDYRVAGDPCPEPLGHSDYFSTPKACSCPPYDEAVVELRALLGEPAPAATAPPTPTSV